jgi:hypothetical protein
MFFGLDHHLDAVPRGRVTTIAVLAALGLIICFRSPHDCLDAEPADGPNASLFAAAMLAPRLLTASANIHDRAVDQLRCGHPTNP